MASVTFERVTKAFGDNMVVKELDLKVHDGEFLVLLGPSGCGKTTTLRLVAGLEKVTSGRLFIGDRCVNDVPPRDRNIAMVFQSYALYPHMNVYDNIAFGLRLSGMHRDEIRRRVHQVASMLGLSELLGRKPRALSGGQRQRVAMGRAIVREPEVFLFDEPLSNLDARLRNSMRVELKVLQRQLATTTIYVTHDQVEAMTLGDRVCVMCDGALRQVGTPGEVYETPADLFVAGFIGTPSMNLYEAALETLEGGTLGVRTQAFVVPLDDTRADVARKLGHGKMTVGIRPQAFRLGKGTAKDAVRLGGRVKVIENLGSERVCHVETGATDSVVVVPGDQEVHEGEAVELWVSAARVHIFDADGKNLLFVRQHELGRSS